jgi:hypothetical protein
MWQFVQARRDLCFLLSLLGVILLYPLLDHGNLQRFVLGGLMFAPVLLATVRLAQVKGWGRPATLLMAGAVLSAALSIFFPFPILVALKRGILAVFFAMCAIGLFSYLRNAHNIRDSHLYTAVSIYLLLGLQWFALYSAIDVISPQSIQRSTSAAADGHAELLYFSPITLSAVGYGDVVPLKGEVRMLAALEGLTGVLYNAITVALIVSAYGPRAK